MVLIEKCDRFQVPRGRGGVAILWPIERDKYIKKLTDGTIAVWGASDSGGTGAPSGNSYTKIYSNFRAFVAVKADGSYHV
jgi:transcription elongation factor